MSRRRLSGWGLIEIGLACCILGTLLCVFIPNFLERVRTSKLAEAPDQLHAMFSGAAAYFELEQDDGQTRCMPDPAGPTPPSPSAAATPVDFHDEAVSGRATWRALRFQPSVPTRYSYRFAPDRKGCGIGAEPPTSVRFIAEGDLDDDDVRSTFELVATTTDTGLRLDGPLQVDRRTE